MNKPHDCPALYTPEGMNECFQLGTACQYVNPESCEWYHVLKAREFELNVRQTEQVLVKIAEGKI